MRVRALGSRAAAGISCCGMVKVYMYIYIYFLNVSATDGHADPSLCKRRCRGRAREPHIGSGSVIRFEMNRYIYLIYASIEHIYIKILVVARDTATVVGGPQAGVKSRASSGMPYASLLLPCMLHCASGLRHVLTKPPVSCLSQCLLYWLCA